MRRIAAVNSNIDSEAPLPEALDMLTRAAAVANMRVPTVSRSTSMQARKFRRAPTLTSNLREPGAGATRFVRGRTNVMASFAARVKMPDTRRQRMASSLLMAAGMARKPAPLAVQTLDVLRARAMARNVLGTLRQRFALNALDMRDGSPDIRRLALGRGRGLQHLVYA